MEWESASDAELSRRCRQGDAEAWRHLIRRCSPTAYRVALQILRDHDEAEDACQEVFLRMYRSFDSYDPTRPLRPWVAKVAYNVCLRRREGVIANATERATAQQLDGHRSHTFADPEHAASRGQTRAHLAKAMGVLDERDRALLVLRYREGLSDAEVAEAADMAVNTVKTRIFRARTRLRRALRGVLTGDDT